MEDNNSEIQKTPNSKLDDQTGSANPIANEHSGSTGLDKQAFAKQDAANFGSPRQGNGKDKPDGNLFDTAKESGGQIANQALGQAKAKASSVIEGQKKTLVSGLDTIALGIRRAGENIGGSEDQNELSNVTLKYGSLVADKIDAVSGYVNEKEFGEIVGDVEGFARRKPAVFFGGAFVLGILAARFLKSSTSGSPPATGQTFYPGSDNPPARQGDLSSSASAGA